MYVGGSPKIYGHEVWWSYKALQKYLQMLLPELISWPLEGVWPRALCWPRTSGKWRHLHDGDSTILPLPLQFDLSGSMWSGPREKCSSDPQPTHRRPPAQARNQSLLPECTQIWWRFWPSLTLANLHGQTMLKRNSKNVTPHLSRFSEATGGSLRISSVRVKASLRKKD